MNQENKRMLTIIGIFGLTIICDGLPLGFYTNGGAGLGFALGSTGSINAVAKEQQPPLAPTTPKAEYAVLEQESLLSKKDSSYSYLQNFVANIVHPTPIVDGIKEQDKYGNDGDKFRSVATVAVKGAEGLASAFANLLDKPFNVFRFVNSQVVEQLNHVGGKIVGLE